MSDELAVYEEQYPEVFADDSLIAMAEQAERRIEAVIDRGVEKCPYCAEEPDEFLMTMVYVAICAGLAGIGYALYAIATQ